MKRVYIDTNIFIDVFLEREQFFLESSNIIELCADKTISGFTSAASISNLFFILKKEIGKDRSRNTVKQATKIINILPVDERIISRALESDFTDFEDAIQYNCALEFDMDYIVTRDEKDFRRSKIPVLSPKKFIEKVSHK